MTEGFIKLKRTSETLELLKDPNAFILLTAIALRADEPRNSAFTISNRVKLCLEITINTA